MAIANVFPASSIVVPFTTMEQEFAVTSLNHEAQYHSSPTDVQLKENTFIESGAALLYEGDFRRALTVFEQAIAATPDNALAYYNAGVASQQLGRLDQSCDYYTCALNLEPTMTQALFNLAEIDVMAGRYEQAIVRYQKAIQIDPTLIAAHNNMGNAFKESKQYSQAIASFIKVLALNPNLPQGHYNLGCVYRLIEDYGKAVAHLSQAIKLQPDFPEAWNNLALTCKNMGDLDRAMNYFNRALQIDPNQPEARWNRSFIHFLKGNWLDGWLDFEARFKVSNWRTFYPHRIMGIRWDGTPVPGKTLLVHDEQGLGDTIQFSRMLPWARQRCGHLILETRKELIPLLQNNPAIDRIIVRSASQPPTIPFDYYIPLISIAGLARMTPQNVSGALHYVTIGKQKSAQWGCRLPIGNPRVGLVWAGRSQHGNDTNRSCNIAQFDSLFNNSDIHFIGLQKGPAASQTESLRWPNFENIGSALEDFGDTAAVLSQLDLLITVDTAIAHLAGAMGRPVWVLIPFIPDWRWGMHDDTTAWYPTMRLYRQHRPKDWASVIDRINHQLQEQFKIRSTPATVARYDAT